MVVQREQCLALLVPVVEYPVGLELEATLLAQPVMKGAGKFWEASRYLEAMGFELVHLKPISGPSRFGARVGRGNTYLNECDAVFSLRRDVVKGLSPQYRVALFAFYLCYRLYEESFSLLEDDRELATLLADRGCELKALSALIRRLA